MKPAAHMTKSSQSLTKTNPSPVTDLAAGVKRHRAKGRSAMTREMILRNRLEMASHNLLCYSANYLCDTPKDGMEEEHKEAAAEVEMLKA